MKKGKKIITIIVLAAFVLPIFLMVSLSFV